MNKDDLTRGYSCQQGKTRLCLQPCGYKQRFDDTENLAQAKISHDHPRRHVPHPSTVACFPNKRPTKEWTLVDANDDRPIESLP